MTRLEAGPFGIHSSQRLEIFLFYETSRLAKGPAQSPIHWTPGALSLGVKWPGHGVDHSLPSCAKHLDSSV